MTPWPLSEAEHFLPFRLFLSDVALPVLLPEFYDLNSAQNLLQLSHWTLLRAFCGLTAAPYGTI